MRCVACNSNLSDYESTRKYKNGEYFDLCNHCFSTIRNLLNEEDVVDRNDLVEDDDILGEDDGNY